MVSSESMTWLSKLMPKRIRTQGGDRRKVPEGLWAKCEGCGAVLYQPEVEANLQVCPKCNHHRPIPARERLRSFLDADSGARFAANLFDEAHTVDRIFEPLFTTRPNGSSLACS